MTSAAGRTSTILLIGASRGLGHAMADDFLRRGWNVVGTVRSHAPTTPLHALADAHPGRVEIEMLDITRPEQLEALAGRLPGRVFDILFVNAGTTNPDPTQTIGKGYVVSRSHFFMDLSHSAMNSVALRCVRIDKCRNADFRCRRPLSKTIALQII